MDRNIRNIISNSRDRCQITVKSLEQETFRLLLKLIYWLLLRVRTVVTPWEKRLDDIIIEYRNAAPANGATGTRAVEYCWIYSWREFALRPDWPFKADRAKGRGQTRSSIELLWLWIQIYTRTFSLTGSAVVDCMNAVGQDKRLAPSVYTCYPIFNTNFSMQIILEKKNSLMSSQ